MLKLTEKETKLKQVSMDIFRQLSEQCMIKIIHNSKLLEQFMRLFSFR